MKTMTIVLGTAAVVGGFILLKSLKASASTTVQAYPNAPATGYSLPISSQSVPMYEVPQASMPKQSDVNVGLSSEGINYVDSHLNITLGTDTLKNIPILGNLFKSL